MEKRPINLIGCFAYNDDYMEKTSLISYRKYFVITWLLIGVVILWATYFSSASGFSKIRFSYPDNDVYEIDHNIINNYTIVDNNYVYVSPVYSKHFNLNYLVINAEGIGEEKALLNFMTATTGDALIMKYSVTDIPLSDGENIIELPNDEISGETYRAVLIVQGVKTPVIESAEFRQSIQKIPVQEVALALVIVALVYILISVAIFSIYKKLGYRKEDNGNYSEDARFTKTGRHDVDYRNDNSSPTMQWIRSFIWLCMILFSLIVEMKDDFYTHHWEIYISIQFILLIVLSLSHCDNSHRRVKGKTDLFMPAIFLLFALYTLISDILVSKNFRFVGAGVFLTILLLSLIWYRGNDDECYLRDFERAIQCFLFILILLSIFHNQKVIPGRFSGPIANPSVYALYLASIFAVLMGLLETYIKKGYKLIWKIVLVVEIIVTMILIIMTQSICPTFSVLIICTIWLFRMVSFYKGRMFAARLFFALLMAGAISLGIIIWQLDNLDIIAQSRIGEKIRSGNLSTLLSGRDYYYRQYLNNMNLLGHKNKPYLWDHKVLPHNAVIGMAYKYGVPSIVPYIVMMIMAIEKSWRFSKINIRYSAIPFYCILSFVLMSLADNVEQYFVWLPWIACYLMFSPIFLRKEY